MLLNDRAKDEDQKDDTLVFDATLRQMYRMAILLLQALRELSRLYHTMLLDAVDCLILGLAVRLQVGTHKALEVKLE